MSTIDRPKAGTLPPLVAGQRLDRATFHDRYEAMPPETRAELIGGVVHMPSPMTSDHGDETVPAAGGASREAELEARIRRLKATVNRLSGGAPPVEGRP